MANERFTSEFLERVKAGDVDAFETLFRRNCQSLLNFARRFVRDDEIAENLVQDVFVEVWQNKSRIKPELNFRIYLFKAVKNKALNHLNRQNAENNLILHLDTSTGKSVSPEDDLRGREIRQAINQAIENLPEKCRLIFAMNRFDGLSYAEIADILKISIKTVETQMGRALKYLRKRLIHLLTFIASQAIAG